MAIPPFGSPPTPPATTTKQGKIKLAGDLGGTADLPTVVDANIDHGSIGGLADDDHTQYVKKAGDTMTGNLLLLRSNNKAIDAAVAAESVYVDITLGNDTTGTGTTALPYKTVQKALNIIPRLLTKDITIKVYNGTVVEQLNFEGIRTFGATLEIRAANTTTSLYNSGTATAGGATTLTDSSKSWTVDLYATGVVYIYEGTGAGQIRTISSNTATELTVSSAWTTNPDATSIYAISGVVVWDGTAVSGRLTVNLTGIENAGVNFSGFKFVNFQSAAITTSTILYTGSAGVIANCYFAGPNSAITTTMFCNINLEKCYFMVPLGTIGLNPQTSSIIVPRGNAFVGETAGVGTGIAATRGSLLLAANSSGNRQYMGDLATGVQLDSEATAEVIADGTGYIYSGCTVNYQTKTFTQASEMLGLAVSNSTINAQKFTTDVTPSTATGGLLTISRADSSLTIGEVVGKIQWWNNDATLTTQNIFADIEVNAVQTISTDAAAGKMIIRTTGTTAGGSPEERITLIPTETVFNDGSLDKDFRVESDGDANMLFVDAGNNRVGIGNNAPDSVLHVTGKIHGTSELELDGDLNHDGTNVGFYGVAPVARQAITALTDNTAAVANDTVENVPVVTGDLGGVATVSLAAAVATVASVNLSFVAVENDIADLTAKVNAIITILETIGIAS